MTAWKSKHDRWYFTECKRGEHHRGRKAIFTWWNIWLADPPSLTNTWQANTRSRLIRQTMDKFKIGYKFNKKLQRWDVD